MREAICIQLGNGRGIIFSDRNQGSVVKSHRVPFLLSLYE